MHSYQLLYRPSNSKISKTTCYIIISYTVQHAKTSSAQQTHLLTTALFV